MVVKSVDSGIALKKIIIIIIALFFQVCNSPVSDKPIIQVKYNA
jgi:hypothetical protein